jgi:ABC-type Fe3+/spermidine/putrescine transport system ATPase subunit
MSDRVAVMDAGQILQIGSPQDVYDRPENSYVADFVGEANLLAGRVAATAGGQLLVDVAAGAAVPARGAGHREQDLVSVVIRPERVAVEPAAASEPAAGRLFGTVRETFFLGTHRKYVLELPGERNITALVPHRASAPGLAIGTRARISWLADDAWVIRSDRHPIDSPAPSANGKPA